MKLKYFNLGAVEAGLWGVGLGLFLGLILARHCPASADTVDWITIWGCGFWFASFVLSAVRARQRRKPS